MKFSIWQEYDVGKCKCNVPLQCTQNGAIEKSKRAKIDENKI